MVSISEDYRHADSVLFTPNGSEAPRNQVYYYIIITDNVLVVGNVITNVHICNDTFSINISQFIDNNRSELFVCLFTDHTVSLLYINHIT